MLHAPRGCLNRSLECGRATRNGGEGVPGEQNKIILSVSLTQGSAQIKTQDSAVKRAAELGIGRALLAIMGVRDLFILLLRLLCKDVAQGMQGAALLCKEQHKSKKKRRK